MKQILKCTTGVDVIVTDSVSPTNYVINKCFHTNTRDMITGSRGVGTLLCIDQYGYTYTSPSRDSV